MNQDELNRLATALGGLCILGCLPGSPADVAGLRYGDIVVEVNGTATPNWVAYMSAVASKKHSMEVSYFRSGTRHVVSFELPTERQPFDASALLATVASKVLPRVAGAAIANEPDEPLLN